MDKATELAATQADPALVRWTAARRQHELSVLDIADTVLVMVDGRAICSVPGHLEGTVSVYPALGSEIFVKQIRVRGEPDLRTPVTGTSHPTR